MKNDVNFTNYKYYTNGNKVIAVSSYGGKTVRGVAKCSDADEFDLEMGKKLAAARCNVKVAEKRLCRADKKYYDANSNMEKARDELNFADSYAKDSLLKLEVAKKELRELEWFM